MNKMFRGDHMRTTASPEYVLTALFALEAKLSELGYEFERGISIETARDVFKES